MQNIIAVVCLLTTASILWADPTPKGFETGAHRRVAVIESEAVGSIAPENIASYEAAADGTSFTVLHIRKLGAPALRVRFENVRLPDDAGIVVYGLDGRIAWSHQPGAENVALVPGESAFIEIQCGAECPGDLPFDIAEVSESEVSLAIPAAPVAAAPAEGLQVGHFRGMDVEFEVRDGLALMEGDMILGAAHEVQPPINVKGRQRDAVGFNYTAFLWPNGIVPYTIAGDLPDRGRVTSAIEHWNAALGGAVRFVPRTSELSYLQIVRGGSCSSPIGKGVLNVMYLSELCTTGIVIHELGHALGLYHEHVREDRDQHVRILTQNIVASALSQFAQKTSVTSDFGPYDFNSIMHYSAYTSSANGRPTIETIPAGIPIGQRDGLSTGDIAAVRRMYGYGYTLPPGGLPAPVTRPPAPAPPPPPPPPPAPEPEPEPAPARPAPAATVSVTITANPATERIVVDGAAHTGSVSLNWTVGSAHTIAAANRTANGTAATFVRWSDGGAATHTVTATTSLTVFRADYALSHAVSVESSNENAGVVTITPASANGYYAANSSVQLTASAKNGYCFTGWSGLIGGTGASATLSVTKPYDVVAQFGRAGGFELSDQLAYVNGNQATLTLGVTGTAGCPWSAQSQAPWIRLSSTRGSGSGTLTYTVDANPTNGMRVGVLVVAGRPFYVMQTP